MVTYRFIVLSSVALAAVMFTGEPVTAQATRGARPAPAQPAVGGVRFGLAGGLSLPAGDLGNNADGGFALGMRGEGSLRTPRWALRGDLTYDRFGGRGVVDAYSYTSLAASLVHRDAGDRFYQFGGLGVYNARTAFIDAATRSSTNLGVQAGIGFDFRTTAPRWFIETGFASAFTSGRSSLWFPVRAGFWL